MRIWPRKSDPEPDRRDVETSRHWLVMGNEIRSLSDPENWLLEIFNVTSQDTVPTGRIAALECSASAACLRLLSSVIAECPVHAYRRSDDGSRERLREHPVELLFGSFCNPWTDGPTFIREMMLEALFKGESFAQVISVGGQPRELHQLKNVSVKYDDYTGEPFYVVPKKSGGDETFRFIDILHLKSPTGASPVRQAARAIELALLLQRAAILLFRSGGMPAGILSFAKRMDSVEAADAKAAWDAQRAAQGAGGISVLGSDAKFTPISFSSVDSQILELRRLQVLEIARFFGISPTLLAELADASLNNAEALGRQFHIYTIAPWLSSWVGAMTRCLIPPKDRAELYIEHEVAALTSGDFKSTAESLKLLVAGPILTADDARQRLNMSKIPGGDSLYPVQGAAPANDNGGRHEA